MILFKKEHVQPILDRVKTQTRRMGNKRWNVGAVHQCKLNYMKGHFADVRIKDVRRERLGDISHEDALAEGYRNTFDYLEAFYEINRIDPDFDEANPLVWVVDFELEG